MSSRARTVTLAAYVRRRNGVPFGGRGALPNMLRRSFGAASFAGFWRYWNPIFGWGLGRFIFAPVHRVAPRWLALIATFLVCGLVHDGVTVAVRGSTAFLFTAFFGAAAAGMIAGESARMDLSRLPFAARAGVHGGYIAAALAFAYAVTRIG